MKYSVPNARLNTFGRPHVVVGADRQEAALQPLSLAVLSYLALAGSQDRDHLANLFWHNNKSGLNSLSTTLARIRAAVPDAVWAEGHSRVGTDIATDVDDLSWAVERMDTNAIAKLYEAPFLGSLRLRGQSVEFENWVLAERSSLASMVEVVLLQRASQLFDAGNFLAAANTAERAWEISCRDGFPSPDYVELYHRILASGARPSARSVRGVAEEFGIDLRPVEPVMFSARALTSRRT